MYNNTYVGLFVEIYCFTIPILCCAYCVELTVLKVSATYEHYSVCLLVVLLTKRWVQTSLVSSPE